ncbi:type II secretion system F family protein [Helcococcus kunzii]|uniref:type II secretion system F family protein n=1 Tax=Helcococcus kunzii TaxID=40091 RepID=UPI0024AE6AC9|nr:type II secretion system F family protein [Helcococcus kunzii]
MTKYISLTIATIMLIIYIFTTVIYFKNIKIYEKEKYFNNIFINQLYSTIGFIVEKYQNNIIKFINTKLIISIKNMYGEKNLSNKIKIHSTKKLNQIFFISIIFFIVNSFINKSLVLLFTIIFIILYSKLLDNKEIKKYKNYQDNFKKDLPAFISRLYLLIQSGLNLRNSIKYIIENTEGEVSKDFRIVQNLIENGMSEIEAYNQILLKSDDILIRKFISNIIQNLQKGGDDLEGLLQMIKKESDEFRRSQIILKTQEANSKLLIPNLMIFSGILIIVMVPILLNIL